jgi:hypothetical protein
MTKLRCYRNARLFLDGDMKNPKELGIMQDGPTMNLVSSKEFRGLADLACNKTKTLSQNIWTQIRSPFLLPQNTCGICTEWDAVEFGIVGCRKCGAFHVCCIETCTVTEIENNHVCNITGTVVRSITFDNNEFITTASRDVIANERENIFHVTTNSSSLGKNKRRASSTADGEGSAKAARGSIGGCKKKQTVSRCINFHERICVNVLFSEITKVCYEKEETKLRNRLRWSFMRHVRASKLHYSKNAPNLIIMISNIASDIENYRVPIMNSTESLRNSLAYSCAHDIYKFTCSMVQSQAVFTVSIDAKAMVIGLLYLLRSGLVHKNMTVLPRCRALTYLLPPENYISMFGVKSKIITECENIVKCHLRTLTDSEINDMGYETVDRIL